MTAFYGNRTRKGGVWDDGDRKKGRSLKIVSNFSVNAKAAFACIWQKFLTMCYMRYEIVSPMLSRFKAQMLATTGPLKQE